jgi:hypothetical protein
MSAALLTNSILAQSGVSTPLKLLEPVKDFQIPEEKTRLRKKPALIHTLGH